MVALAGGVGAARFLRGLVQIVPPAALTVIVNTGDDRDFFGLRVCPDLDIVTYTLAGIVREDTGWGVAGDSFHALDALRRFRSDLWFALGDRDLATHLHRTQRLREGVGLASITAEIARAHGLRLTLLPMSEDPAPTRIVRQGGHTSDFEEYLVRDGAPDDIERVDLSAASQARPAPGVLEALREADHVLICPSNPIVSIGTIRAVQGVEAELVRRADAVAVSPIIDGRPVKGPADRLLRALGAEVSAAGVAGLYAGIARGFVIDEVDAELAPRIEPLGLRVRALPTWMRTPEIARQVALAALELSCACR